MLSDPGETYYRLPFARQFMVASIRLTMSPFPFGTIEAQSLQLSLTACRLDYHVLNLWGRPRRPMDLYPVAGQPCRDGIYTRWSVRPCPAALSAVFLSSIIPSDSLDYR